MSDRKWDRPNGTVWVVNRDLGEVAIFDAGTGDLLRTLPVGRGAHDICISEQARTAYITAESDNAVTAVDTEPLATESIPVGPLPHHLDPSHDGRTIYVSLASHPTSSPAVGAPQYAATSASGIGGVVVVDVRTRQIVDRWEYPGIGRPHGIWYSRKAARF